MKPRLHNKILSILIFLVLIIGVIFYLYHSGAKQAQAPTQEQQSQPDVNKSANNNQQSPPPVIQPAASASASGSQINLGNKQLSGTFSSGEGQPDGSAVAVQEVDFDGKQFSPASLDINVNDWVFFKNKSQVDFWPIANPASAYPTFDAKAAIAPGKEFKFQFAKAGKWAYQDQLSPSIGGIINVGQ